MSSTANGFRNIAKANNIKGLFDLTDGAKGKGRWDETWYKRLGSITAISTQLIHILYTVESGWVYIHLL